MTSCILFLKILYFQIYLFYVCVHHMHTWYLRLQEDIGSPETGCTTDSYESDSWERNLAKCS